MGRHSLPFALFFASGMAALVYQVVWSRMLTLLLGVGIFAVTAVVCTYMAGLAIGSWLVGRYGERWRAPLAAYGIFEAAIGIYAAATPWLLEATRPVYVWAFRNLDSAGLNGFRILLSAGLLLLPTVLMGGTLPLLSRAIHSPDLRPVRGVGALYAVNTLGAVVGCLLAGFVLLAELGIRGSLFLTAALSGAIALAAFAASRSSQPGPRAPPAPAPIVDRTSDELLILGLFLVAGFAALGYEVLWTRALLVYLKSSTYAFSVMLGVYLTGIGLGSLAASPVAGRSERPLLGLGICQLGVAASVIAGIAVFPHLDAIGMALIGSEHVDGFGRAVALMLGQASVVLLLPTAFMGAMFPFGFAAYHRSARGVGHSVGTLYSVNTLGNIAGSVAVGFFAIEWWGVRGSLLVLLGLNLFVAAAIAVRLAPAGAARLAGPVVAVSALVGCVVAVPERLFYRSIERSGESRIVFYREGASDTVAVIERERPVRSRTLLYSDGRGAAGTSSLRWNLYFGHLPMLLHRDPREVLHICYGSGNSVLALTRHRPERIDVVELSPHVRDASPYFWTNEGVLEDPAVNLVIGDGRNFLLGTERSYDAIALEPPNIFTAGVVNLYTVEFYELALARLKPGGIFTQWLPSAQMTQAGRGHLLRSFTEVFPHVYVFQQLSGPSLLLLGTREPLRIDLDEVDRKLSSSEIRADARTMTAPKAERLLSFFLLGTESARALAAPYEPARDDRSIVDFEAPRYVGAGFGFARFIYPIASEAGGVVQVGIDRRREYAQWGERASLIVPDPAQAARVDRAIRRRMRVDLAKLQMSAPPEGIPRGRSAHRPGGG